MRQLQTIGRALYDVFEDSGFSMAGAMAFSFTLSLFPFCIFLAAMAATLGGPELARSAVDQLFALAPKPVAEVLAPEIERVMSQSRYGLLPGRRIVEVDGKPTPDLDSFLKLATGRADRTSLRIKTLAINGAPEMITLKIDRHYWSAYELRRNGDAWERRPLE